MNSAVFKMPIIETRALPESEEKRNNYLEEMESLLEKAKMEKRNFSIAETNRFNELKQKIAEIDRSHEERYLENLDNNRFDRTSHSKALTPKEKEEIRSFVHFVRTGEARNLASVNNGAVIPKTVSDQIISRIKEISPLFKRMTHYNVTGNLSIPVFDWESLTTGFTEDFAEITSTSGPFLTSDLKSYPIVSLVKIGKSLINQTTFDVISVIIEQIGLSFSNFISDELINNTSAKLSGTLQAVSNTVDSIGGSVTVDDLISLQMAVPSVFQPNSAFLMHPSTFKAIRQLKDTTGNPLLISGNESLRSSLGYSLLGADVLLDENMPEIGTGNRVVYYGDFTNGLICNTNADFSTQVLVERFSEIYATGILCSIEMDTNIGNSKALSVLIGG